MNALLWSLQENLGEGLKTAFKAGVSSTTSQSVSVPMSAEVFRHFFGAALGLSTATLGRLLCGVRQAISFDALCTLLHERGVDNIWFRHAKDAFVARVDEESRISVSFSNKSHLSYSHKACQKCSVAHSVEDICAGKVTSVCNPVPVEGLQQTFVELSYTRCKHNSSLVYCAMNNVPHCL